MGMSAGARSVLVHVVIEEMNFRCGGGRVVVAIFVVVVRCVRDAAESCRQTGCCCCSLQLFKRVRVAVNGVVVVVVSVVLIFIHNSPSRGD